LRPGSLTQPGASKGASNSKVGRWFGEQTSKELRRDAHGSVRQLDTDIRARIEHCNENRRAVRLDQNRRRDTRLRRALMHTNQRITTLAQQP
jgi:hypothetical protein